MSSSSLFSEPLPLVPQATWDLDGSRPVPAALESNQELQGGEIVLPAQEAQAEWPVVDRDRQERTYSLFPSGDSSHEADDDNDDHSADFLGRLHHLKTIFRMSATKDPVSVMIHKVGPVLILDDGPSLNSFSGSAGSCEDTSQPRSLAQNSVGSTETSQTESQLMLGELDPALENTLLGPLTESVPPGLPPPGLGDVLPAVPTTDLGERLIVKNTFLDILDDDEEDLHRTRSAPGRMGIAAPYSPAASPAAAVASAVQQDLQTRAERAAGSWQLIPYQEVGDNGPTAGLEPDSSEGLLASKQWDLIQCNAARGCQNNATTLEAVRSLLSDIPPQPSRFGRAVEWRCGPYKILLGCDLIVLHSADKCELSTCASFKMLPEGSCAVPSREERLDVYLENMMCDITKVVWGAPQDHESFNWRVFNTADLPGAGTGEHLGFDANQLKDQGQRLLHFLRQQCHREGGTYWLFREKNSRAAELFDLSSSEIKHDGSFSSWETSPAFRTTPSLAAPIASLCLHLAKAMPQDADQRQLLQKGLHLLEPMKEEHFGLYSMTALQLACSYMRTPVAAISDAAQASAKQGSSPPAAARLSVALRYLESVLKLLTSTDGSEDASLRAGLLLQVQVAYAECIVKLVREACIPTYSSWLAEVQQASQELIKSHGQFSAAAQAQISQMKQLSAAYLLWRLFWLCRARRSLSFLVTEKREVECWTLDRDLCEVTGDTLYGLSRYPADDVTNLLSGKMATAQGICKLVEDGLHSWGLRGPAPRLAETKPSPSDKKKTKRLPSPAVSPPESGDETRDPPHNVAAMFLSKMNPLNRGIGDRALKEDALVRDDLRPALWTEGQALKQSLHLFERATARLRKSGSSEGADQASLKVARKLAHLYNEEARAALVHVAGSGDTERAEELLSEAHRFMLLSGDESNASRVLLNLSELHARRAERSMSASEGGAFSDALYQLFVRAIECCEEASALSEGDVGRRQGAFAHLRVAVHLSVRVPVQPCLEGSRRDESLAELADRHFGKALRGFDDLKDERELAVCHFHMADLALQEQKVPGAAPMSKPRLTSALRHARRSAEYWERVGALEHIKDFVSSHIRVARLLECQKQRQGVYAQSVLHLAQAEAKLLELAKAKASGKAGSKALQQGKDDSMFTFKDGECIAVAPLRREMSRICQNGIKLGEDIERLKLLYRQVLRNEGITCPEGAT
eukprot:TRINITY_DN74515_c0_g1_i1.p1 TRINITY_DN74515_c0_g1~~TRINITY_DN74515_c0_g1_i1.p1  ORF type:complete len:1204 (-),score=206.68 TRINITY_DN74515_c0_g1_i1:141-3752(-)